MKHYTNTFHGHTTVVVEIEKTLPLYQLNFIEDMLDELARYGPRGLHTYVEPLTVINKHDEDIRIGHRFVVLCQQRSDTIDATISDIAEIVSTGSLLTDTGHDLLAKYKEAAE